VTGLAVGDAVAVFPYHVCGTCSSCNAGDPTGCELMAFEGIQGKSGGMATSSVVDASACFKLPDGVDLRLGALVEPMSVAWHGVSIAEVGQHEVAVVIGGGPIGVGTYFALVAAGVRQIVVSEPSEERRAILQRLGVQHVVDPITEDLAEVVSALSSGDGAGAVIDCAGSPRAFAGAMSVLGRNGRMVIVAAYESPIEFDTTLLRGGRSVRSSAVYTRDDFAAVIEAMGRGVYRTEGGWIDIVPFEGVQAAIESLRAGRGMKVLVETP
jgi:(R,R)-butanediol dehydrogenase/meso-butanediol dehydrogenase/diacetyl reductase